MLTDKAHAGVTHDCLLVFAMDILVVDPAHVKSAILETTVKMLDITHHPRHFDASLECQTALHFHLLPRARRSPWPKFTEVRHNNDFIKVCDIT